MALRAVVYHTAVVKRGSCKIVRIMANAAVGGGWNVNIRFTHRIRAVVTRCAIARDTTVIECRVGETHRIAMAGIALFIGGNVVSVFTRCDNTVMAGAAIAGDARVIIRTVRRERHKRLGVVAGIALGGGCLVERGLADRSHAVVAATARSKNFEVINKRHLRKANDRVTGLARVASRQVVAGFTANEPAVALGASRVQTAVVEVCG